MDRFYLRREETGHATGVVAGKSLSCKLQEACAGDPE